MFATHFHPSRLVSGLLLCWLLLFSNPVQASPAASNYPTQLGTALDWQTLVNTAEGFQVEIPIHWKTLQLSQEALAFGLDVTGANNPQLQGWLNSPAFQQMMVNGMKFYAIDLPDSALGYDLPPNVNIIKLDLGNDLPIATLKKLNERQLKTIAVADYPLRNKIVTSNGREALFFQYVMSIELGLGQPQLTQISQLLLVENGTQSIVTVSVPLAAADEYLDTVAHILDSFQLLADQPAPTPALAPAPAPQIFATVQVAKLNVRTGPGTGYGAIGSVSQNERLRVTGRVDAACNWLQVQLADGKTGWIAGPPTYSTLESNCSDIARVPPPPPPPPAAKPCVRFDNHFSKEADVNLTMPANPNGKPIFFKIAPHGRNRQCLAPGRYTFSVGVPGVGSVNGEFTLEKGDPLLVIPIYQEF